MTYLRNVKNKTHNHLKIFPHVIECNVDGKRRSIVMRTKRTLSIWGVFYHKIQ